MMMDLEKIGPLNSRRLFIGAIAFFILAKLVFIFLPINALGMPRTGDDALHYLWGGKQILQGYDTSSPALSDILMQHGLDDDPGAQPRFWRSRVHFRTIGSHSPIYDLMMAAILATAIPLKWAFAVSEAIIAVVMGFGIAIFLRVLFGALASAAGLVLLSFLVLPVQDLFYFVASTLALSLALMLTVYLLRRGEKANPVIALLAGFFLLGLHPISRIYLFIAVVAWLLTIGPSPAWWRRNVMVIAAGLGILTIAAQLLPSFAPLLGHEAAGELRSIDFGEGLRVNMTRAAKLLSYLAVNGWGIVALAVAAPFIAGREKALARPVIAMFAALSIPLAISLVYSYPDYPAEIFGRLLVPLTIILAGMAGVGLVSLLAPGRPLAVRGAGGLFALAAVAFFSFHSVPSIFHNLNARNPIINQAAFTAQLDRLAAGTTMVYLESDVTLVTSLHFGGGRFGAIAAPMLIGTKSLESLINSRMPTVAVLPVRKTLNLAAWRKTRDLNGRRNGFPFRQVSKLRIDARHGKLTDVNLSEVHLWVTNPDHQPVTLTIFDDPKSPDPKFKPRNIIVAGDWSGWLRIDDPTRAARSLLIGLPDLAGWIEGISVRPPRDHVRWPWGADIRIATLDRGHRQSAFSPVGFSIAALLKESRASLLRSLIRQKDPVLSDDSGFVFLNTVFSKEN